MRHKKIRTKKIRVAASTTTQKPLKPNETYQHSDSLSRAKLQTGKLFLHLKGPLSQKQQRRYWNQFEVKLRSYVNLKKL